VNLTVLHQKKKKIISKGVSRKISLITSTLSFPLTVSLSNNCKLRETVVVVVIIVIIIIIIIIIRTEKLKTLNGWKVVFQYISKRKV
jgi:hypothetical protein